MLEHALMFGVPAGLAALTAARARLREARREARFPPIGQRITVEGRQIHLWQAGDGPDLVLIHGSSANLREFMDLAGELAKNFRVTLVDRPGLGWSDGGRDDLAEQARLMALAVQAAGVNRPLVLGHSYGGAVALAWALQAPVAGLALVSGVAMPWEGGLDPWYRVNRPALLRALILPLVVAFVPRSRVESAIASVFAPQPCPPGYATASGIPLVLRRRAMDANIRQVNSLLGHVRAMVPLYSRLTMPVEILHGDSDSVVPHHIHALPLAQNLPDAALTLLPGVGHMPHQTHPADVLAAVKRLAARAGLPLDCREATV